MENNYNQDKNYELEQRATKRLEQMTEEEKTNCVHKEKLRTYLWLCISLYCSLFWIIAIFVPNFINEIKEIAGPAISCIIAGIAVAVFMVVRLFKNNEQLALVRIKRQIKREDSEALKEQKRRELFAKLGFTELDVEDGFNISKIATLGVGAITPDKAVDNPIGSILIDDTAKRVIFKKSSYYSKAFNFSDILKYDVYENERTVIEGKVGASLVGGVLLGPTGAIIGSSKQRIVDEEVTILKVIIYVNNLGCPKIEFAYLEGDSVSKTSRKYTQMIRNLQDILAYLEYIMNNFSLVRNADKQAENLPAKAGKEMSKKERLEEIKELLSAGLISQEDFEQKKKQILGL